MLAQNIETDQQQNHPSESLSIVTHARDAANLFSQVHSGCRKSTRHQADDGLHLSRFLADPRAEARLVEVANYGVVETRGQGSGEQHEGLVAQMLGGDRAGALPKAARARERRQPRR